MNRSGWLAVLVALVLLGGCGSAGAGGGGGGGGGITVFAAASLTESFTELGKRFEAKRRGTRVTFNFAGSSALAKQIEEGAPADVFASASLAHVTRMNLAGPVPFARNRLMIAVPAGNPGGVTGLADFAEDGRKIALCAEQVPCGAAAARAFAVAGVTPRPDTLEQDVKAVLTKVSLGEVDAALVYRTDVRAAGEKVEGIEFPEAADASNEYSIAVLEGAPNPQGAEAFIFFVLSAQGDAVLAEAGFEKP